MSAGSENLEEDYVDHTDRMRNSNTIEALTEIENAGDLILMKGTFNQNDLRDLQVLLDQPQKHVTPFETYISYQVSTKTSRIEFEKQNYVVRRRYSDFEWLRNQLSLCYPTLIVPPLPEKHSLFEQIDRYDRDFITSRMQLLHRFLNRLADHPVLSCDKKFEAFLIDTPVEFSTFKKSFAGFGLFGKMSESLQNMASSYVAKGRTVEFEKMSEYVDKLSEKIRTMEKIGQRIQKERTAYLQDLQMVQPILNQWQAYEPNLSQGLQAIGEAAITCADAQRKLVDCQKPSLSVPLHEYGLYTEAAKDSLRNRDNAQIDYEVHMEQLCRVKAEQTQLETAPLSDHPVMFGMNMWKSPEQVQQQRMQQLETGASTLAVQVEVSRDKMECANENLRADFERWNQVKSRDLKNILQEMADLHIKMYEQSLNAWSKALPIVKNESQAQI
ncbi:sorting nexin-7-like isoform X2 [Daphnia pulicaria]|uniref:sorting nexin-7-like isoform X2 n=1 Tax=Daphnia pulicaria TaxID=35523 RepID=UPI001EEA8D9D|nr:sorting nexin-7-like isoform X2 [Daphnia pulicaria]